MFRYTSDVHVFRRICLNHDYIHICLHVTHNIYLHTYICIYIYMYVYIYIYMCIYMHSHIRTRTHTHTHIHMGHRGRAKHVRTESHAPTRLQMVLMLPRAPETILLACNRRPNRIPQRNGIVWILGPAACIPEAPVAEMRGTWPKLY